MSGAKPPRRASAAGRVRARSGAAVLALACVAAAGVLAACVTTRTRRPADAGDYTPRPVVELARWRIETDSVALGHLLHLEIQDPLGPIRYYRVENAAGEWVGHVSDQLRFSRRVPFAEHEEILGTYAMREGLGWLFATHQSPQLVPVATEAVFSGAAGAAESGARDAVGTGPRRLK